MLASSGAWHREGGWPKEVDPREKADVLRWRKKAEKDAALKAAATAFQPVFERCLRQNTTVDVYEEYFPDGGSDRSGALPKATTLAVFRDSPAGQPAAALPWLRPATSVAWRPSDPVPSKASVHTRRPTPNPLETSPLFI